MTVPTARCGERGTGMIGTAAGVGVFLVFLLFAVQLIANLYATSTVDAAGHDAARHMASRTVDHRDPRAVADVQHRAERQLRRLLGGIGRQARITWTVDDRWVRVHVQVRAPGILPSTIAGQAGPRAIDRTYVVRVESR